jgi:uncharacterized protein RhaS with RHS repeats
MTLASNWNFKLTVKGRLEYVTSYSDMVGRPWKTVYADGAQQVTYYNNKGQVVRVVDPDGVTTLYDYNAKGEPETTALSASRGTSIAWTDDRITRTVTHYESNTRGPVRVSETFIVPLTSW